MSFNLRVPLITLVGMTGIMMTNGAGAWVKNISLERVFVGESIRVHEVQVRCRIEKNTRTLRKNITSGGQWCSVDVPDLCARAKVSAARKMCKLNASEYKDLIAKSESGGVSSEPALADVTDSVNTLSDDANSLKEEQLLIEEQRIEIEQRRIELTRREVGLRKQLTELGN